MFSGKIILVTGGTGSFGHQIVKDLIKNNAEEVRILSRDEKKQDDMRKEFSKFSNLRFIVGDVRDLSSLEESVRKVDIIFHAAALKQVPSCEYNVFEAVKTNIIGARNVILAALAENVPSVVAVSTDKAVEPVNVMGMTKAIQERLFTQANLYRDGRQTVFSCVRYGNVLGSRGSVVPLFYQQIKLGRALTLTDERMTRFILTLPQSIQLVFKAAAEAIGGEIFVLKIPAHTVKDLAEVMLEELPARNKEIKITGIRPGEKINETLVSPVESLRTIELGNYYIILPSINIKDIREKYNFFAGNQNIFRFSSDHAYRLNKSEIKNLLQLAGWIPNKYETR